MFGLMKVTLDDRCRRLAELETRMSVDPTYPDYWRTAAEQYRDAFLKSAARPGFYVPIEFRDGGPLDSAFGRLRKFVEEFAELVRWWGRDAGAGLHEGDVSQSGQTCKKQDLTPELDNRRCRGTAC
jgi:hypothetical protein